MLVSAVVKGVTDKGSSVSVSLANGTELPADYVIVTVPLGVLKEGAVKFTPPLPADKQTAIKDMVSKVLQRKTAQQWGCCTTIWLRQLCLSLLLLQAATALQVV